MHTTHTLFVQIYSFLEESKRKKNFKHLSKALISESRQTKKTYVPFHRICSFKETVQGNWWKSSRKQKKMKRGKKWHKEGEKEEHKNRAEHRQSNKITKNAENVDDITFCLYSILAHYRKYLLYHTDTRNRLFRIFKRITIPSTKCQVIWKT